MAKTWRRAIQKYGSLGAISFEKAFSYSYIFLAASNATQRYSTLRYATLLYDTLRCSTLLYAALRCSTLLYAALRCSTLLYAALRYASLRRAFPHSS
jgi:hypothetical protein